MNQRQMTVDDLEERFPVEARGQKTHNLLESENWPNDPGKAARFR